MLRNAGNWPSGAAPQLRCEELARLGGRSCENRRGRQEASLGPGLGVPESRRGWSTRSPEFAEGGFRARCQRPGVPEDGGHHEARGGAVGRLQRGTGGSVLPIFIFLLCKLIEELGSSDFPTPATPLFSAFFPSLAEGNNRKSYSVCVCVCVYTSINEIGPVSLFP